MLNTLLVKNLVFLNTINNKQVIRRERRVEVHAQKGGFVPLRPKLPQKSSDRDAQNAVRSA